jgi:small-conductance mechanosensitive channel
VSTSGRALVIFISALALIACLVGNYLTRDLMANLHFATGRGTQSSGGVVDQGPWKIAAALAPLAVSAEEQRYAKEAERLADHEVDQAFAMALRQATLEQTHTLTGDALALSHKVEDLQRTVKDDKVLVDSLTEQMKGPNASTLADDLEVATAQLALDTDVLNDAVAVLARQSGDQRSTIQQELSAREAAMHFYDEHANTGGQTAVASARSKGTLYRRLTAWFSQRSRRDSIMLAKQQADSNALSLKAQYAQLQISVKSGAVGIKSTAAQPADGTATQAEPLATVSKNERLESLKRLSAQISILSVMGDRVQTLQQLSAVYDKWSAQVLLQHRIVWHLMLESFAWIAFIILCAGLVGAVMHGLLERPSIDHRRKHTLHTILLLATQVVALLCILLVIFGPPNQVPTILGLATAGLTLAFQDFIIAFLGWFVLMGKNGIRVGDWIEINGVRGEVVEIGLLRTSLLETGNWTDRGHPTGRRITFLNKFAISGQYFNFSTTGQWMWDEIKVNIPSSEDSHKVIELIHRAVVKETEKDANLATVEWERVTERNALSQFSAIPAVEMRPAASGTDIIVRYVTRATDRFETRNRLYQAVIDLLHRSPSRAGASVSASKPVQQLP